MNAHVQRLVSVVKMEIVNEEYYTEEQHPVVRSFLWEKGLNAKDINKEMLPVDGGKCLSRKAVHNWIENFSQGRSKDSDDETEVRKWLRQQTKTSTLRVSTHW
jgi:hypothetical protein